MDCEHCRPMREHLERINAELGRPLDSFDPDRYALPLALTKVPVDDVCTCACHDHLRIAGRRP